MPVAKTDHVGGMLYSAHVRLYSSSLAASIGHGNQKGGRRVSEKDG